MRKIHCPRPSKRNFGGAYTFLVLAASATLLAMGGAFIVPARHSLEMNSIRLHRLSARHLAESGLQWALHTKKLPSKDIQLQLDTGKVNIHIERIRENKFLVISTGSPKNRRFKDAFSQILKATVESDKGQRKVTSVDMSLAKTKK